MPVRPKPIDWRENTLNPSKIWLFALALLIETASLSQLPLLQENAIAKVGLSIAEFTVLALMLWGTRRLANVGRWFGMVLLFVLIRFGYAWLIGYLRYGSTLAGSLQEGRFGLLIVITPVAYAFFRSLTMKKVGELALGLALAILFADILVTWFFVRTGYLSLGGRGANRYVISALPLIIAIWIRTIVLIKNGEELKYIDFGFLIFGLLHIGLFSTSRTEAIMCCAVIGQWLYYRFPHFRWPMATVAIGIIYLAYNMIQPSGDAQVAGRDYRLAMAYSRDAFPFGVGLVPEAIQKVQLGTAGNFFASDYGPILLIYRYGIVGICIGIALVGLWLRFAVKMLAISGGFIVAIGILSYFLIVPLLDYGSMIGGLLLGAMVAVMTAVSSQDSRIAEQDAEEQGQVAQIGYLA